MPSVLLPMIMALTLPVIAHAATLKKPEPVQGYRYQIVTADDSAITRRIVDDLVRRLVPTFAEFRTELAQRRRMVYVAVGPEALRRVAAEQCDCVVISAFTSSQVVRAIVGKLPAARAAAFTAVYAEPAPDDQLRLAAQLYRRKVTVAAILGSDTVFLKPALEGEGVTVLEAGADEDINRLLGQIAQTDALLALPDSAVYNTENFRNILLSTYRHKQGVIGFSSDMVKAGALATTYSEVEDIDAQVTEIAAGYVTTGTLPAPQFPRYFRTIVNEGVARSLDIAVPDSVRNFARPAPARRP
jgi:CheY-like chemotaxis protein